MVKKCTALLLISITNVAFALDGGIGDLKNVCDHTASQKELRLINATALMVANSSQFIRYNASTNTYSITNEALFELHGTPVCSSSPLFGEPYINGNAARTGFLIAPDKVMTAAHAQPGTFTPNHWLIVFRSSKTTQEDPECSNFTWENIPAENVYYPDGGLANTFSVPPVGKYDYAVIKLNRSVLDRAPLRIRRSGRARPGDLLLSAGYPNRGGEKIDINGVMVRPAIDITYGPFDASHYFLIRHAGNDAIYNIHGLEGSSGSPVYNANDDVVESVVAYGTSAYWHMAMGDPCVRLVQSPNIVDTNGSTADIQNQIPRTEVLVRPLDYVKHVLDVGGVPSHFTTAYSIESATPLGGETVSVGPVVGPSGNPSLFPVVTASIAPGDHVLSSNPTAFSIDADVSALTQCGTFDYELTVRDITNDHDNHIRHHFEIGLREFYLSPDDVWQIETLGPPFNQARTYEVKNVRPTPTHVMASTYSGYPFQDFLRINGLKTLSFNLGPAGSDTDSATVIATLDTPSVAAFPLNELQRGRISFYHQPYNCSVASQSTYVNRDVDLVIGKEIVQSPTNPALLSIPTSSRFGTPHRFEVDLSGLTSDTCVADLNLIIGLPSVVINDPVAAVSTLKIDLVPPKGAVKFLWTANSIPASNYIVNTNFGPEFMNISSLRLDDQSTPPMGPNMLGLLNGIRLDGKWFVDISTNSTSGLIAAGPVQLEFTGSNGCLSTGQ